MSLQKVALIGRVNVGKSTLFNKLISKPKALVSRVAGTTRDRNTDTTNWRGIAFELIDTAGLLKKPVDDIEKNVEKQVELAISQADFILFVVDNKIDIQPQDRAILKKLRKSQTPYFVVANKADNLREKKSAAKKFLKLGEKDIFPLSANNGTGTGDLLDELVERLSQLPSYKKAMESEPDLLAKVTMIGKTNAGKSSLMNKLVGKEYVVVSNIPHTTREPQDTIISFKDQAILLIDTAGIRKKKGVRNAFDKKIYKKSLSTLSYADIALFVLDISEEMTSLDKWLLGEILESGVSVLIVVNKWDKIEKDQSTYKKFELELKRNFPFAQWLPHVFVSAKTGHRVKKVLDEIIKIHEGRNIFIEDNAAEKFIKKIIKEHKPQKKYGNNAPYVHGFRQVSANPPKFEIVIGAKQSISDAYLKFIERKLREKFGFYGSPIRIGVKNLKHGISY